MIQAGLLLTLLVPSSAAACDSVASCEVGCESGKLADCATLSDLAWANPWGLGLQADRLLWPRCEAGELQACVVLGQHRANTIGGQADALLLGPCGAGDWGACRTVVELGVLGNSPLHAERRRALAKAAGTYAGPDPTVPLVLMALSERDVADSEAAIAEACRSEGYCAAAVSLLAGGVIDGSAIDWPRLGVAPPRQSEGSTLPRVGGVDGTAAREVIAAGSTALAARCAKDRVACFEGVDLGVRLSDALTCDRRQVDCTGLGHDLLENLCAVGSPVGCTAAPHLRRWRQRDPVAWFEERCTAEPSDTDACLALAYGLRHVDTKPVSERLRKPCEAGDLVACADKERALPAARPAVVLLTTALSGCAAGDGTACVDLGQTLVSDDAPTAAAWFEALACRAGDEAACLASWRLQLGERPGHFGQEGHLRDQAEVELARLCVAGDAEACGDLGELTEWKDPALKTARAERQRACLGHDLKACAASAELAQHLSTEDELAGEVLALERHAERLCAGDSAFQLSGCEVWSELERGFLTVPGGRLELAQITTRMASMELLTKRANRTCASDSERCADWVGLAQRVRATDCWTHEACPTETETFMREACRGGNELACQLRADEEPGAVACGQKDHQACVVSATWRAWRGLPVAPGTLELACADGVAAACELGSLEPPRATDDPGTCSAAVDCDERCRGGERDACRYLAKNVSRLQPGSALALETLSDACERGSSQACRMWASGVDARGLSREPMLVQGLSRDCELADAMSCLWLARFEGKAGVKALTLLATDDCARDNLGACGWAIAGWERLEPSAFEASPSALAVATSVRDGAVSACRGGAMTACQLLGYAQTGREVPVTTPWPALTPPLPDGVLSPSTALLLPTASPDWGSVVKARKKACAGEPSEDCTELASALVWQLESCSSARCASRASKSLCGLGVTPLCAARAGDDPVALWAGYLRAATAVPDEVVADARAICVDVATPEACVVTALELVRRDGLLPAPGPEERLALSVACKTGADFACR